MKIKRYLLLIFCFVVSSLFLACGDKQIREESIAVSIVLGRHANANEFSDDCYERVQDMVERAVHGGYVSVVISDGSPKKIDLIDEKGRAISFKSDGKNEVVKKRYTDQRSKAIMNFIKDSNNRAQVTENDLLSAIKEARASLNNKSAADLSNKYILILDSGVSTAGDLKFQNINFTKDIEKLPIKKIIKKLQKSEGVLPDLEDINIQFIGLGDVAYPQKMDDTSKVAVRNLWKSVLKACGANVTNGDILIAGLGDATGVNTGNKPNESIRDDGTGGDFPAVTPIQFNSIDLEFGDASDGGEVFKSRDGIPTDALGFKANTAEYIDADAALYILKPYADGIKSYLEKNPDEKIYLVGSVAVTKEGDSGDFKLSKERAEKVKRTLVENYNLQKEQLVTIGLGGVAPWHINEFVNGVFNSDLAANNRAVWILKESSEKYGAIPDKYKK